MALGPDTANGSRWASWRGERRRETRRRIRNSTARSAHFSRTDFERAHQAATDLDGKRKAGERPGILSGVPFALKM